MTAISTEISCQHMVEATSHGLIATDAEGTVVNINDQGEIILGISKGEVFGRKVTDVLPLTGRYVMACLEKGVSQLGKHLLGSHIGIVADVTPIRENDAIVGTVSTFQEIQQFENTARQLQSYRQLNKQLEAIFDSSSDGINLVDSQGILIKMNTASEVLMGTKASEVLGQHVAYLIEQGIVDRIVSPTIFNKKEQISIVQYVKQTDRHVLITGTPVFDDNGEIVLIVVNERDMTQLNKMQVELEQSQMVTEKFRDELAGLSVKELKEQEIIAESKATREIYQVALKLAKMNVSDILILGESGTGKGLLAQFIHNNSSRKDCPFIQINCAALPESLLEAELFGYVKGAFTGARNQGKAGLFELAHGGTIFLDEIGDMPVYIQAKILKYLDDRQVMRLGSIKAKMVDCTIIAATNRDLSVLIEKKQFRQDLFYRLNTFKIKIPPLRERIEDIFELAHYLVKKFNKQYKLRRRLSQMGLEALQEYNFPGNVRELENILKKSVILSESDLLDQSIIQSVSSEQARKGDMLIGHPGAETLTAQVLAYEKRLLENARKRCRSSREMAALLGLNQSTIVRKLKKHGLS